MDVLKVLRKRVDALSPSKMTTGLKHVLAHLDAAEQHIRRGKGKRAQPFNDAIYQINQAFEGSLREAYEALSGLSADHVLPHKLEEFLKSHLSTPVIAQLATYRQGWRNLAAHDHRAYFTEDEAILAHVSVTALALLLVDVIATRIGAVRATHAPKPRALPAAPLVEQIAVVLKDLRLPEDSHRKERPLLAEITGAVRGYLGALLPTAQLDAGVQLVADRPVQVDLLATLGSERVIIEIKRQFLSKVEIGMTIERLLAYMQAASLDDGVLYVFRDRSRSMSLWQAELKDRARRIFVVHPVHRFAA